MCIPDCTPPFQFSVDNSNSCNSSCRDSNCCFPFFGRKRERNIHLEHVDERTNNIVLESLKPKFDKNTKERYR